MSLPLESAKYRAHAVAIQFGTSKNNNVQVAVTFEIDDEGVDGAITTWIGHFTDATSERTIESLRHCGWEGEDLSELDGLTEVQVKSKLPSAVELVCEPEEYNGRTMLRVRWVNGLGSGFSFQAPLSGAGLKQFAAQMRSAVAAVGRGSRGGRKPSGGGGSGGGGDFGGYGGGGGRDDIPF